MTWAAVADAAKGWLEAIGGISGATALMKVGVGRRNARVDSMRAIQETSIELLDPLRRQLAEALAELDTCTARARAVARYVEACLEQIRGCPGPCAVPPGPTLTPREPINLPTPRAHHRRRKGHHDGE